MMQIHRTVLALLLTSSWAVSGLSAETHVGVLDADAVGGKSFGEQGILKALARVKALRADVIKALDQLTLATLDVLVLPDVHDVGNAPAGWREAIRDFVVAGGGVLLTHDSAGVKPEELFPEAVLGTTRHVSRAIKPVLDHPVAAGVLPFVCRFGDHRVLRPGPAAQVLLRGGGDQCAGVIASVGKGGVVHIGAAIGLDEAAQEGEPNEDEARLLVNAVLWLAGRDVGEAGPGGARIALAQSAVCQPAVIVAELRALPEKAREATLLDAKGNAVASLRLAHGAASGRIELATAKLPDGEYTVRVSAEGQALAEATVLLEGQAREAMAARDARIRARHRNQVIKFEFTQGYALRKDWSKARPFLADLKAHGIDSFDYGVFWGGESLHDAEFGRFDRMCGYAQELGLSMWATLVPPSGNRTTAALGVERGRELYREAFRRLAAIARRRANFIGITFDDFDYNLGFFSPEFCAELAAIYRPANPHLAFMPLMYWRSITPRFIERYEPYIDGLVFHFRAGSDPESYILGYDPKSFDDYRHVLHYELSRVRRLLGKKTLICGLYQWYYKGGWGVMTPDGKNPTVEHQCADARQKYEVAHEYADGVRLYGLGIIRPVYDTLKETVDRWQKEGKPWGWRGLDVEPYHPPPKPPAKGKKLGTIIERGYGVIALAQQRGWVRHELYEQLNRGPVDLSPFPLLLVGRTRMSKSVVRQVEAYVRDGGTLFVQSVPGWVTDASDEPLAEGEIAQGNDASGTLAFARLSGVEFRYGPRGFVTRLRVVADHPFVAGLPKGEWRVPFDEPLKNTYPYLAHPVRALDATVLIEAEHEVCPYNGVEYARQGKIRGVFPFVTVAKSGRGTVIRWYPNSSAHPILGTKWFETILDNALAGATVLHAQEENMTPFYADKMNLLAYTDAEGHTHPVQTPDDWRRRREHILANMQLVMGPLPGTERKVPLDMEVIESEKLPQVTRKKITYVSEATHRVPAYLLVPNGLKGKAPAMLCLHGSSGARGRTAGLGVDYARYALELAQRGYVTLAPDYPLFGDNKVDLDKLGYVSGTMKGVWDHLRAVDLLQALPEVDGERIGCIGLSLGGHNSLFVAAFDGRIKVAVSSSGFDSFSDYMGGNLGGWCQRCYMPRIAAAYDRDPKKLPFDFPEVLAAIAPRALYVHAPLQDSNFRADSVRRCVEAAMAVYRLLDAERHTVAVYPPGGHGFPPDAREAAYAFVDRVLCEKAG